jgi:hypothetical protein
VILVDSGVLVAAADADDRHHRVCADFVSDHLPELVVPAGVVVEVSWLLGERVSTAVEAAFLRSVGEGAFRVETINAGDYLRMAELVRKYRDLRLDAVDAMVVAVAERLGATTVATVDRRDFSVVRPRHVSAFQLVPDLGPKARRPPSALAAPAGERAVQSEPPRSAGRRGGPQPDLAR